MTPSFIHVNMRRLMGASIGRKSKIRFGTLLLAKKITIGENVTIGPFSYINCRDLKVDDSSKIKSLSVTSALQITLGKHVHIAPLSIITGDHTENSYFQVGDHSRIFPFCWIETGEGVEIGKNVGIGGHSLIFTHGVWPDYIDGGPVSYGPVKINDNVWLPWRVFVLPNVEIGSNSIIGANSTVNKSIPNNVVAAGSPAKVIKDNAQEVVSSDQKIKKAIFILEKFSSHVSFKFNIKSSVKGDCLVFETFKIMIDDYSSLTKGDLVFLVDKKINPDELSNLNSQGISCINHIEKQANIVSKNPIHQELISFLRKYGIRLYIK